MPRRCRPGRVLRRCGYSAGMAQHIGRRLIHVLHVWGYWGGGHKAASCAFVALLPGRGSSVMCCAAGFLVPLLHGQNVTRDREISDRIRASSEIVQDLTDLLLSADPIAQVSCISRLHCWSALNSDAADVCCWCSDKLATQFR